MLRDVSLCSQLQTTLGKSRYNKSPPEYSLLRNLLLCMSDLSEINDPESAWLGRLSFHSGHGMELPWGDPGSTLPSMNKFVRRAWSAAAQVMPQNSGLLVTLE